jgi:hypothetical protein
MYLVYTIDYIHQLQTLKKKSKKKNGYRLMTNNKTSNKNRKK